MSLKDLLEYEMKIPISVNPALAKDFVQKGSKSSNSYDKGELLRALLNYKGATGLDNENIDAQRNLQATKNKIAAIDAVSRAMEVNWKDLPMRKKSIDDAISLDPNYEPAKNLRRMIALMEDDWVTIGRLGILTGPTMPPNKDFIETYGLEGNAVCMNCKLGIEIIKSKELEILKKHRIPTSFERLPGGGWGYSLIGEGYIESTFQFPLPVLLKYSGLESFTEIWLKGKKDDDEGRSSDLYRKFDDNHWKGQIIWRGDQYHPIPLGDFKLCYPFTKPSNIRNYKPDQFYSEYYWPPVL